MSEKFYIGDNLVDFRDIKTKKPISKVTLMYDDENGFSAGDNTGMELVANCYFATQQLADKALALLSGHQYHAYSGTSTDLDPAAELGDGVTLGGVYSVISRMKDDGFGFPDLSAPGEEELEEEFPHPGFLTQDVKNKVTLGADYYGTRITRAKGIESVRIDADGNELARAVFNADELAFYAGSERALYFDPEKKRYAFKGDVEITGNIKMAAGSITWTDGGISSGISSEQVNTIITERLVSSPTIAGGLFYGRDADGNAGDTWMEIGTDGGPGGGWGLLLKTGGFITTPLFGIYNADANYMSLSAKGFNFLVTEATDEIAYPKGTWDFEDATVKGFSRLENLDGNIELSAGNGLVSVNLDPDARQIRFWFGPGNPVWALDADGLHEL